MKNKISAVIATMIVLILLASSFLPTRPAYAGLNGQQIKVNRIMVGGATVKITGRNQHGTIVTRTWRTPGTSLSIPPAWGYGISTHNNWWKGLVFIEVISNGKVVYACQTSVPPEQFGNWVNADMALRRSINTQCGR